MIEWDGEVWILDIYIILQVDINETDEYGYTGLHMAAENGHLELVSLLLENGAGINKLIFESLLTPLHLSLSKVKKTKKFG